MVILRKIRAATLVETLVASVIILVVFVIASLSLNNVFRGVIINDDSDLQNRINELVYLNEHSKIAIPFYEENQRWDIAIEKQKSNVILISINKQNKEEQLIIIDNEDL